MTGRIIRVPHRCTHGGTATPGTVWECDECRCRWVYAAPGNPAYEGWRRTIPELLGLGVLRRRLTRRTPAAITPPGLDRPASRNPSDPVEAQ